MTEIALPPVNANTVRNYPLMLIVLQAYVDSGASGTVTVMDLGGVEVTFDKPSAKEFVRRMQAHVTAFWEETVARVETKIRLAFPGDEYRVSYEPGEDGNNVGYTILTKRSSEAALKCWEDFDRIWIDDPAFDLLHIWMRHV